MNLRPWAVGIVGALILFVAALWSMWVPSSNSSTKVARPSRRGDGDQIAGPLGAVPTRFAEAAPLSSSLGPRIRGIVVDPDGMPVEFGTISVRCLHADGSLSPIAGGMARIGPGGEFVVGGCEAQTCARLQHPTMVPIGPWVLEPGDGNRLVARTFDAFRGTVLGPDDDPIVGAIVSAVPPPGEVDPEGMPPFTTTSTTTDGEGAFAFFRVQRPPCGPCEEVCRDEAVDDLYFWPRVLLVAGAKAMQFAELELDLSEIGEPEPISLKLSPALSPIRGELALPHGSSESEQAYVLARSEERPYEQRRADVIDGRFQVDGVGSGTYILRVLQNGAELDRVAGVRAGATVTLGGGHFRTGLGPATHP